MDLPKLSGLLAAAQRAAARFPFSFLSAIVGTAAACWAIDSHDSETEKFCTRIVMAASIGLALLTALTVFSEKKGHSAGKKGLFQALGLLVVGGLWWTFQLESGWVGEKTAMRFGLWWLIAHLAVSFAAFTAEGDRQEDFWEFNKQLFSVFVVGALYSFVIWAGVAVAFAATDALFDNVQIRGESYARLFFVVVGLFQTSFVLSNFPRDFDFSSDEIRFDRSVVNLVKFILIPIVGLYLVILYAYSGKIVGQWSLPKGWVTGLVIGFSGAGIFTWLMNFFLPRIDSSSVLAVFKKWYWAFLAPMLGLLFLAVGRRLADYGVTEPRFVGATTGVWLVAMAAYFLFSKSKDLRALPMSMAGFAGLCLLPFLGMFDASERSQAGQFLQLLSKNGLFDGQKMAKIEKIVVGEDAARARDILQFLQQRDALGGLKKLLPEAADSLFRAEPGQYDWQKTGDLAQLFGFEPNSIESDNGLKNRYVSVENDSRQSVAVTGFDRAFQINFYKNDGAIAIENREAGWLAEDGRRVFLIDEKGDSTAHDLGPFFEKMWRASEGATAVKKADAVHDFSPKIRLNLLSASLEKGDDGQIRATSIYGWLLVKN